MCWFKKKNIYKIVWKVESSYRYSYAGYVKAYNAADAYTRLCKQAHVYSLYVESIEVVS